VPAIIGTVPLEKKLLEDLTFFRGHIPQEEIFMNTHPQQNASAFKKSSRGVSKISIVIWIALVLVIGIVLWACMTEGGQLTLGTIMNKGVIAWLFGEGNLQAEAEAAAALEKAEATVIKEGENGVTYVGFGIGPNPSDETLKQIANLTRLKNLSLSKLPITDDQLAYFSKLNQLSGIIINDTNISDDGLQHLLNLPALQTLYANNTKITDKGLEQIAKITNLTNLDLSNTEVTDKGMKEIAKLKKLKWLLIWNTKVTEAGLENLLSNVRVEKGETAELQRLTLSKNMKISQEALDKISKKHPALTIEFSKPTVPAATPPGVEAPAKAGDEKATDATTPQPDKKAGE
jgi:hypothetical protein